MAAKPSPWTLVPANTEEPDLWTDCVIACPLWEGSGSDIEIFQNSGGTFGSVTTSPGREVVAADLTGTAAWGTISTGSHTGYYVHDSGGSYLQYDLSGVEDLGTDISAGEFTTATLYRTKGSVGGGSINQWAFLKNGTLQFGMAFNQYGNIYYNQMVSQTTAGPNVTVAADSAAASVDSTYVAICGWNGTAANIYHNGTGDSGNPETTTDLTTSGTVDGEYNRFIVGDSDHCYVMAFMAWNRELTSDERSSLDSDFFAMFREASGGGSGGKNLLLTGVG